MQVGSSSTRQLDLFTAIGAAYAAAPDGTLDNATLYQRIADQMGVERDQMETRVPIGRAGAMRSPLKRQARWFQQSLKQAGVLEKVPGERGVWRLSERVGKELDRAIEGVKLVAFSTKLGVAIWGRSKEVFAGFHDEIALVISSPPFLLRTARDYGHADGARQVAEHEYIDFICASLEPVLRSLIPGGSLILNLTNDSFEPGSPARSLYLERLVLALHDRLGLSVMDRIPWINYSKPPQPTYWACRTNVPQPRVQLASGHEYLYWLTNDPSKVRSDNRRVLKPHRERHQRLIAAGGEQRTASYGDGAHRLREGAFSGITLGTIPKNIIECGHACADTKAYRQHAARLGLPAHGAMMPTAIPDFFIRLLTEENELVVDLFGGTARTGLAAERLGRRWMVTEWIAQYLRGAAEMFRDSAGFRLQPAFTW